MLKLSQFTGFGTKRRGGAAAGGVISSLVFDGVSEHLVASYPSDTNMRTLTISAWMKLAAFAADGETRGIVCAYEPGDGDFTRFTHQYVDGVANMEFAHFFGGFDSAQACFTTAIALNTWYHVVLRLETANGTADNRVRMYVNGSLEGDDELVATPLQLDTYYNDDAAECYIGTISDTSGFMNGKLAFIDVVDGLSLTPSSFAFNNGGTWTRQPYTGSYGTNGFAFDGTDLDNVAGTAMSFTAVGMDGTNLDSADLPPYTT